MALTIGFDGTAAVRQQAGIGRYTRELLAALDQLDSGDEFRVLGLTGGASDNRLHLGSSFKWFDVPLSDRIANFAWQRLRVPLPVEARIGKVDVFHSPDFSLAPSLARSIVTIHDLAFELMPQVSYPTLAAYLHKTVPRSIARARAVIAPSRFTRDSIVRCFGTPEDKIEVIPEGVSSRFQPGASNDDPEILGALQVQSPFVFTAGTLEPRKNLERLIRAFVPVHARHSELKLIIAGQHGWMYEGIFEAHRQSGLGSAVRFVGHVDDSSLVALYRGAEFTIYPALLEGFGLPALEALAAGSPLIAGGNSSVPEVCGDSAVYVDPWDEADLTSAMLSLIDQPDLRRTLRETGPTVAEQFTWERAARSTLALYHHVTAA